MLKAKTLTTLIAVVAFFSSAGLILLLATHAATSSIAVEAESGSLAGKAAKCPDASASGGSKVRFGLPSCGTYSFPLIPGNSADAVGMWYYKGYYYLSYNGDGNNFVMRKASSLAGLATSPLYHLMDPIHNPSVLPASIRYNSGIACNMLHWNSHWYCYTDGNNGSQGAPQQLFVIESAGDDPLGPYAYKATFDTPPSELGGDGGAYGPAPFVVNGQLYLTQNSGWNSMGKIYTYIAKMTNPWTVSGGWKIFNTPTESWECANNRCLTEGATAMVRGGKVFLTYEAGGYESPDYVTGMLTASVNADLTNPASWTKTGPVFKSNPDANQYGASIGVFFKSPDGTEDWFTYHATDADYVDWSCQGRMIYAKKVNWRADGTPDFGVPLARGAVQPLPSGDPGL